MTKTALNLILLTIVIVLAQAIVFNHVCLFDVAMPFVFIYVIFRLPINLAVNWVLTIGFLLGLTIDIFSDTYGMNALAGTITAMSRRPVLRLFLPPEDESSPLEPSMTTLGVEIYAKYLLTMTLIFCALIFLIESFTFFNIVRLLLRILASTILSWLLMLGIDCMMSKPYKRRF